MVCYVAMDFVVFVLAMPRKLFDFKFELVYFVLAMPKKVFGFTS